MNRRSPPSVKLLKRLYDYDKETGLFRHKVSRGGAKEGEIAGTKLKSGRVQICVAQDRHHAHRLAWLYTYGVWPIEIDHKDRDPSNNAIVNLRPATRSQNTMNGEGWSPLKKRSRLPRGVGRLPSGRFSARICINRTSRYLGTFETVEDARQAHRQAARKYFGEFAL